MEPSTDQPRVCLYTVGHASRPLADFLSLLQGFAIASVVDIRSQPASTRHPWFDREALELSLVRAGITYHWFEALGGWQRGWGPRSPNLGLPVGPERAYADAMGTEAFRTAAGRLLGIARVRCTVALCAERRPAHCHRRLLADYLEARGATVRHIVAADQCLRHRRTPFAVRTSEGGLVYRAHAEPHQEVLFEP